MLTLLLLLLPTAVCLMYFIKFLSVKIEHRSYIPLLHLSIVSALYFFADANYNSAYEDYQALVISDIILSYTAPALPALVMLFLRSIVYERYVKWYSYLVVLCIPCTLGALTLSQYLLMGMDGSMQYLHSIDKTQPEIGTVMSDFSRTAIIHFAISIIAYYIIMCTLCVLTIWQVVYYMRKTKFKIREIKEFFISKGEIEPLHIEGTLFLILFTLFILRMFLPRFFILEHQWIAVVFACMFALLAGVIFYVSGYIQNPTLSLDMLQNVRERKREIGCIEDQDGGRREAKLHGTMAEDNSKDIVNNIEGEDGNRNLYVDMLNEQECHQLLDSIKRLMREELVFLTHDLTIEDVAHSLCTNKSYISRCINKNMGITFRDYVNSLRIEHAKQMMLSNPDMLQEEIATLSGFCEASQFNRKFKQYVGVTPRQWILAQKENYI